MTSITHDAREVGPYRYRAAGLTLASTFPLVELPGAEPDDPVDVLIDLRPPATPAGTVVERASIGDSVDVDIRDGNAIHLMPRQPDMSFTELSQYATGACLAVALRQRGKVVLHGSTCAVDGRGVAFIGPSGDGKSTMIEAMVQAGHRVLGDDLAILEVQADEPPLVVPGIPRVRLHDDAAVALGWDVSSSGRAAPKAWRQLGAEFSEAPVPLHAAFVLGVGDQVHLGPCSTSEAFAALAANTRGAGLLTSSVAASATHLAACGSILRHVEIGRLIRPWDLTTLPDVVRLVEHAVRDAGSARLTAPAATQPATAQ